MGNFSYYGIKTICFFKLKEFFHEFQHTIISPLISTFLFVIILNLISGYYSFNINNTSYVEFLAPGIVMLIVMQSSYQHISENLITMKEIGNFNDYLMSPLSRIEILVSFMMFSVISAVFMAFSTILIFNLFIDLFSTNFFLITYYLILTSLLFSSIGAIVGFLYFSWEAQQGFLNFFIIPIIFLSGTFYSIDNLNINYQFILKYNPFYLLIDNFRNCFDENLIIDFKIESFLLAFCLFFITLCIFIYKKGFKVIS